MAPAARGSIGGNIDVFALPMLEPGRDMHEEAIAGDT